jgi:two-component system LytT family response regulator
LRTYAKSLPYIIFITSYPHYALEAIHLDAVDYLLKPIDDGLLEESIRKFKRYLDRERGLQLPPVISKPEIPNPRKIMIPSQSGYYLLEIRDIIRMAADVNYTRIYVKDNPPILVAITLKYFEVALKGLGFFRVHKSHLINLEHIDRYQKTTDGGLLTLMDESTIPVSRNVRGEFHLALQAQVISMGGL